MENACSGMHNEPATRKDRTLEVGPDMDLRELKGLELAARSRIAFHLGFWLVPSQTSGSTYRVTIGAEPSCTCPDFELRRQPCKHVVAARLVAERDGEEAAGVVVDEEVPKRPTY